MDANTYYSLELFPTEGNWDNIVNWFGGSNSINRDESNAGVDMFCIKKTELGTDHKVTLLDLGVVAKMHRVNRETNESTPVHFWLAPRSSIWKNNVIQANSIGIIDRCYRGTLMGAVYPICNNVVIEKGTRLFQILAPDMGNISKVSILPLNQLDSTSRGSGGFGSTGN